MRLASRPPPHAAVLTRPQARIVWAVIAAAFVAALVGVNAAAGATPRARDATLADLFLLVAGVIVTLDLVLAYVVTAWMRRKPSPGAPKEAVAGVQVVVGSAIALGAALMCCVFYFVAREPLLLLLTVPCAAVLLHWFPSESRWARITPGAATAPPARRMIRE